MSLLLRGCDASLERVVGREKDGVDGGATWGRARLSGRWCCREIRAVCSVRVDVCARTDMWRGGEPR